MPRPKKTTSPTEGPANVALDGTVPTVPWLSLARVPGGYAVLRCLTSGREVQTVEVLAGPLPRGAASAALRVETARQFLIGKGPR